MPDKPNKPMGDFKTRPAATWSSQDVATFLTGINNETFAAAAQICIEDSVDGKTLQSLAVSDLESDLGLRRLQAVRVMAELTAHCVDTSAQSEQKIPKGVASFSETLPVPTPVATTNENEQGLRLSDSDDDVFLSPVDSEVCTPRNSCSS